MNFYLVPTQSVQIGPSGNQQTVNMPEYVGTDITTGFSCIPYGVEGIVILSLAAPNVALAAEGDVYAFPADLTGTLADADVSTLNAYTDGFNIPEFATAGMTWAQVLATMSRIFLAAQTISGANGGNSLFTLVAQPPGKHVSNNSGTVNATLATQSIALPSSGAFGDLSNIPDSNTVGETLLTAAATFTAPVFIGPNGAL